MADLDAASAVRTYLKSSVDAVSVRDCLVAGADSIYEAGDLEPDKLAELEGTRRTNWATLKSCALVLAIQDAGEDLTEWPYVYQQPVVLRVYDRNRGYRNIRTTREALKDTLHTTVINLDSGGGILDLRYGGRAGHRYDPVYAVTYEAVTFVATVQVPEPD